MIQTSLVSSSHSPGEESVPVMCTFPDGETRMLVVADFSLSGLWIRSMRPPHVGTEVSLVFETSDNRPLPAVPAVVITARIDPKDARNSGFEVALPRLQERTLELLIETFHELFNPLLETATHVQHTGNAEHRRAPRVDTELLARLVIGNVVYTVRTANLSMSGVLVGGADEQLESVPMGTPCTLVFDPDREHRGVRIEGEIVRRAALDGSFNVGVTFRRVDARAGNWLERHMLAALVSNAG